MATTRPPLAVDVHRPTTGHTATPERLVFVHGFTQTRHSWDPLAASLRDRYESVTVDAPGHGQSGELRLDLVAAAATLAETAGRASVIGYSMGGRLALHLALAQPDVVQRLVLVSTTAGLDAWADREQRRLSDEQLAIEIERDGVAAFVERWLALPLFAGLPRAAAQVDQRLTNTAAGLSSSLRLAGTGAQASLWSRVGELRMPVLVVVGAGDTKFVAIGERLHGLIAGSELIEINGAGHTVHLEAPEAFESVLRDWLARTPI